MAVGAARIATRIGVLESETGSGKTEAALWRFAELFRAHEVDGLYFAVPTRVAATQIFERVKRFRDRIFPMDARPAVVLAVRVDNAEGARTGGRRRSSAAGRMAEGVSRRRPADNRKSR